MKKTDKFKGLFLKAGEFIKTKKGYCVLAVILMIFLAVFLSGIKIETVSEHNRKQTQQAEERKSMLAQIEKEESSGEDTQSTTETGRLRRKRHCRKPHRKHSSRSLRKAEMKHRQRRMIRQAVRQDGRTPVLILERKIQDQIRN